jgi:hypothetical protein
MYRGNIQRIGCGCAESGDPVLRYLKSFSALNSATKTLEFQQRYNRAHPPR